MADEVYPWQGEACFIVGPIGSALDLRGTPGRMRYEESLQMWEKVFEPACDALGLQPIRADKIAEPGEIPEQIFLYLRDAPVVIADVTEGNPNVMYELGLRHTRDLITVQVGEYARLPFDIASIRTIQFRRTEGGLVELRDALVESLRAALEGRGKPVTATRVWNEDSAIDPAGIAAAVQVSSERDAEGTADEPGFMDVLAEGEAAIAEVTEQLTNIGTLSQEAGGLAQDARERIAESDARRGGFAGRLRVAKELASQLAEPAESMDNTSATFDENLTKVDAMIQYIIARANADEAEAADARAYFQSAVEMIEATREAEDGVRGLLSGVVSLRKIARDLAPVSKTMERAINRVLKGMATIQAWEAPMLALLAETPDLESPGGAPGSTS